VEREVSPQSAHAWRDRALVTSLQLDGQELAAIFLGGSIGAIARGALAQSLPARPDEWPWATFIVNILGALLLGYVITRLQERLPPSMYRRAFLATGFCGAFTTFSTMMVELLKMIDGAHWMLAVGYAVASVSCGLCAVFLATKIVRRARLTR
jgi:fluoride exporter